MLKLNTDWEWNCADEEDSYSYWICYPLGRFVEFYLSLEYRGELEDPEADVEWEVSIVMDGRKTFEIFKEPCPGTAAEVKRYLLDELGQIFLSLGAQLCREPVTPVLRQLHTYRPDRGEREELLGLDVFGRVWRRDGRVWRRLVGSLL